MRRSGRAWLRTAKLKLREGIRSWSAYTRHETGTKASQAWRRGSRRTSWTSVRRLQAARREEERGAKWAIWEPGDRFADWMRAKRRQKQKLFESRGAENNGNKRNSRRETNGRASMVICALHRRILLVPGSLTGRACEREPYLVVSDRAGSHYGGSVNRREGGREREKERGRTRSPSHGKKARQRLGKFTRPTANLPPSPNINRTAASIKRSIKCPSPMSIALSLPRPPPAARRSQHRRRRL